MRIKKRKENIRMDGWYKHIILATQEANPGSSRLALAKC
jgi:hypothetical protein